MKNFKTIFSIFLMMNLTFAFGQYDKINISRPFGGDSFSITTVVQEHEIVQLQVTNVNGGGECLTEGELFITFNDRTYLKLTESETTTDDCGNVYFDLTPKQANTLLEFSIKKITYSNRGENKNIAGTIGNSWYFMNYIQNEIDKEILNLNL